jgi:hypothetical protein
MQQPSPSASKLASGLAADPQHSSRGESGVFMNEPSPRFWEILFEVLCVLVVLVGSGHGKYMISDRIVLK